MPDSFAAWCGHLPHAAAGWCGQVLGFPEELVADPVGFTVRVVFVAAAFILIMLVWKRRRVRAPATAARESRPPHTRELPSPLLACRGVLVGLGLITAMLNVL